MELNSTRLSILGSIVKQVFIDLTSLHFFLFLITKYKTGNEKIRVLAAKLLITRYIKFLLITTNLSLFDP
ncbi:MAG: hypothetical protein C4563_04630 [Desulfobulbus sp.]|nr:MAG: hypothetical protein C4563_04630 [Desulfobulbus sp.]